MSCTAAAETAQTYGRANGDDEQPAASEDNRQPAASEDNRQSDIVSESSSLQRAATIAAGLPTVSDRPVTREELVEQGMAPHVADSHVVQENMNRIVMHNFQMWIGLFTILVCLLLPMQLGFFIWLASAFILHGSKCQGPLQLWAWGVFSLSVFNCTINKQDSRNGSCVQRIICCFSRTAENPQPVPLRVHVHNIFSRIVLPFAWNCLGIYWVRVDHRNEVPCETSARPFYMAAQVYTIFSLVFTLITLISVLGLVTLLRYAMRHGLLRSSKAADPQVIEKCCKVVTPAEIDLEETPSCTICLEDFDNTKIIVQTRCNHYYHKECLKNWLNVDSTCPNCRREVGQSSP